MSIWFYIIITLSILINIILFIKIVSFKNSLNQIDSKIKNILKSDTNNLISLSTSDKHLKKFANNLNLYLKTMRIQKLKFENGNKDLHTSIVNISHDLRTPLTAIKGYIDLLKKNNLDIKKPEYIKIIETKTDNMIELTEQLFDFSKFLDLSDKITKEPVVINEVLENVLCSYFQLFKEKEITPKINLSNEKIIKELDKFMLIRIFENILSNIIKYTTGKVEITIKNDGSIIFSNETKKLDKTRVGKIFDRYYTLENAKKSEGIGLAISKQLVELNNGEINAQYKNNWLSIIIKFN